MKTTLVKWCDSQGVRLPKHLLESADIDAQPRKSIEKRFLEFTGTYDAEMIVDWGRPAGEEIW